MKKLPIYSDQELAQLLYDFCRYPRFTLGTVVAMLFDLLSPQDQKAPLQLRAPPRVLLLFHPDSRPDPILQVLTEQECIRDLAAMILSAATRRSP